MRRDEELLALFYELDDIAQELDQREAREGRHPELQAAREWQRRLQRRVAVQLSTCVRHGAVLPLKQ